MKGSDGSIDFAGFTSGVALLGAIVALAVAVELSVAGGLGFLPDTTAGDFDDLMDMLPIDGVRCSLGSSLRCSLFGGLL